jgi:hypothetical protein
MNNKEAALQMLDDADKSKSARVSWPFQTMAVREGVFFPLSGGEFDATRAQMYCHVYGKKFGREFMTRTITNVDGVRGIMIVRVK